MGTQCLSTSRYGMLDVEGRSGTATLHAGSQVAVPVCRLPCWEDNEPIAVADGDAVSCKAVAL